MRDLITIQWIEERDTAGLISDSTSLEDAITQVSFEIADIVGHDFGDSTSAEETLDGVLSPTLFLEGKTEYPLRSIEDIQIDDVDIGITSTYLIQYTNRAIGLIDKLRLKAATWNGHVVTINGDWGWTDTPDDVKEAIYRILVKRITGSNLGDQAQVNDTPVKSIKTKSGISIEYAVSEADAVSGSGWTFGDDFADRVIEKYIWATGGGVV